MAAIHSMSRMTPLEQFDLFTVPPTQLSIEKDLVLEYRPTQTVSVGGPQHYEITSAEDQYVLLNEIYYTTSIELTINKNEGGRDFKPDTDWLTVFPANNILHNLFSSIKLSINNKAVTMGSTTYPYRAYIEKLLGYSNNAKKSFLENEGYFDDRGSRQSFIGINITSLPKTPTITFELRGKLHFDLSFQQKALLGRTKLEIELYPNKPEFILETGKDDAQKYFTATIKFVDPKIEVHKACVSDILISGHRAALSHGTAKYPITRVNVVPINIVGGLKDFVCDNLVNGQMPRRAFAMFVDNDGFLGNYGKNPFHFENADVSHFSLFIDGISYPSLPYTPDFKKNKFAREHMALFQVLNQHGTDAHLKLSRQDFKDGNTIFAFNFAPDLSSGAGAYGHVNLIKRGTMRAHIRFAKEVPATGFKLLLYLEYDNLVEMDEIRTVMPDYQ